ncbi:dolichol-phosphate mannosyltransferase [Ferrithrix thermotolerans DSM 19514]|uniref:Dolichol-phosphate mannosyltransferase n=1 Tax=Ferrithrix thermotolerans DSM 19514 TaxID=1121881 RepID=A0A1M4S4Z8_9ACTN|nr:polyprenol monophosphomannose synthase [Ferrithrix thermotolerans]SHE27259.1 dolichol-phosphate mannosyltransferase [Ferrithrix thermotolerans DSM 19514]
MTESRTPSESPYVVIPTYNEAENLESVISKILESLPQANILVVDDSSPDGTADLARKLATKGFKVEVMERPSKSGLGSAYRDGFRYSLKAGATSVVEIDADLSHDPKYLPKLMEALDQGADLAIGSRYVPGGAAPGLSPFRLLVSRGGNVYAAFTLGIPVRDSTAGFRAYRREALEKIAIPEIKADGYGFQVEMAYEVHRNGGKIVEIPIVFHDRVAGGSKMSIRIVVEAMVLCTIWGAARKIKYLRNKGRQDALAEALMKIYDLSSKSVSKALEASDRR